MLRPLEEASRDECLSRPKWGRIGVPGPLPEWREAADPVGVPSRPRPALVRESSDELAPPDTADETICDDEPSGNLIKTRTCMSSKITSPALLPPPLPLLAEEEEEEGRRLPSGPVAGRAAAPATDDDDAADAADDDSDRSPRSLPL